MSETLLKFEGVVTGQFELDRTLAYAPKVLAKYFARGLGRERSSFVGSSKKNKLGSFQAPLLRRTLWGGRISRYSQQWSVNFLRHFRGKIYGGNPLQGMTLEMGVSQTSKMRPIIELLQSGGGVGGKRMVIPVYGNLRQLSVFPKIGSSGEELRRMSGDRKMFSLKRGDKIFFFDREIFKRSPAQALMFISISKVSLRSQFDFDGKFKEREPAVIQRLAGDIDKGVAAINRGQYL